eukprot:CAMPEP_0197528932 /NCGR_PEP_ID=MMETSP1318-20131121/26822_1 /TAXON_ID=552666 /ORGANISM="Partenskyella glossopodia, Strain RCC365" /LENGTH=227 /DNA_ID=CAMNT_0043084227 /DNA_START=366 /DNA_END=1045 /DNA_ORIENTATION=-
MNRYPVSLVMRLYQMLMAMILALALVISIGCLFFQQSVAIFGNITGIEQWIRKKAEARDRDEKFIYPYDLGYMRNWKMVMGANPLVWFFPVEWPSSTEASDGVKYPIKEGCGEYDLTIEQLTQKSLKQKRSFVAVVVKSFNSGMCGSYLCLPAICWNHGCSTAYKCPDCEESRLSVTPGDVVKVTRVRSHWLYARKLPKVLKSDDDGSDSIVTANSKLEDPKGEGEG